MGEQRTVEGQALELLEQLMPVKSVRVQHDTAEKFFDRLKSRAGDLERQWQHWDSVVVQIFFKAAALGFTETMLFLKWQRDEAPSMNGAFHALLGDGGQGPLNTPIDVLRYVRIMAHGVDLQTTDETLLRKGIEVAIRMLAEQAGYPVY